MAFEFFKLALLLFKLLLLLVGDHAGGDSSGDGQGDGNDSYDEGRGCTLRENADHNAVAFLGLVKTVGLYGVDDNGGVVEVDARERLAKRLSLFDFDCVMGEAQALV